MTSEDEARVGKEVDEIVDKLFGPCVTKRDDTIDRLATKDGAAPKPSVPCTASALIAEWIAENDSFLAIVLDEPTHSHNLERVRIQYQNYRLSRILDAIRAGKV